MHKRYCISYLVELQEEDEAKQVQQEHASSITPWNTNGQSRVWNRERRIDKERKGERRAEAT
jgi:hypothetical protein